MGETTTMRQRVRRTSSDHLMLPSDKRRSSSEGRVSSRRPSVHSFGRDSGIDDEVFQQSNAGDQTTTENDQTVTVLGKRIGRRRSFSTGSSDSFDSDGQWKLCTPDYCVMDKMIKIADRKKTSHRNQNSTQSKEHIYLLNPKPRSDRVNKLMSVSLCQFCGGEMKKPTKTVKHSGILHKSLHLPGRIFSYITPAWWREPEFIVHPKPKIDKTLVHHHTDSLLSTSSGFTNYYGFLNLCLILLVLSNARLFLENIMKYGVLVNFSYMEILYINPTYCPNLLLTLLLALYPAIALLTEKLLAKSYISNRTGFIIYFINLSCLLISPAAIIYYLHPIIVFSMFTLGCTTLSFLKLISYGHTNYWYRDQRSTNAGKLRRRRSFNSVGDEKQVKSSSPPRDYQVYPENLHVKDLAYFMVAPTLCYELNFPRSARIRKRFLIKRVLEMVFLIWLSVCLVQQWIVPTVNNAKQPLAEMEGFKMLERLLKLSIPNHFIWLIFFYWFFHSALNIVAELTRFGDREFYKDWWNADSVSQFWQHWNIPVHRFGLRHIYKPLLGKGVNKLYASIAVFFISAFFHEYLVSVPLRMFKIWAFTGMLMQVPMAMVTNYIHGKWGNIFMWLSVILGQPVAILAYFHDYYIANALPAMAANTTTAV